MELVPITLEDPTELKIPEERSESKSSALWVHEDLAHVSVQCSGSD